MDCWDWRFSDVGLAHDENLEAIWFQRNPLQPPEDDPTTVRGVWRDGALADVTWVVCGVSKVADLDLPTGASPRLGRGER